MTLLNTLDALLAARIATDGGSLLAPVVATKYTFDAAYPITQSTAKPSEITIGVPVTPPRWRELIAVSFETETSSTTIAADGNYLIGDRIFVFSHASALVVPWYVEAGTGLVIKANATGTSYGANTAPVLRVDVPNMVTAYPVRARIRYVNSYGSAIRTTLAFDWTNGPNDYVAAAGTTVDAGHGFNHLYMLRSGGGVSSAAASVALAATPSAHVQDVLGIVLPSGCSPVRQAIASVGSSLYLGYVPGNTSYVPELIADNSSGVTVLPGSFPWEARVALSAEFTTHSESAGVVIAAMQIEAFY